MRHAACVWCGSFFRRNPSTKPGPPNDHSHLVEHILFFFFPMVIPCKGPFDQPPNILYMWAYADRLRSPFLMKNGCFPPYLVSDLWTLETVTIFRWTHHKVNNYVQLLSTLGLDFHWKPTQTPFWWVQILTQDTPKQWLLSSCGGPKRQTRMDSEVERASARAGSSGLEHRGGVMRGPWVQGLTAGSQLGQVLFEATSVGAFLWWLFPFSRW